MQVPTATTVNSTALQDIHEEQQSRSEDDGGDYCVPTNIIDTTKNSVNLLSETPIMKDHDSNENSGKTTETNDMRMTQETEEQHESRAGDNQVSEDDILSNEVIKESDSGNFTEQSLDSNGTEKLGNSFDSSDNPSEAETCNFNEKESKINFVNTDPAEDQTSDVGEDDSAVNEEEEEQRELQERQRQQQEEQNEHQKQEQEEQAEEEEQEDQEEQEQQEQQRKEEELEFPDLTDSTLTKNKPVGLDTEDGNDGEIEIESSVTDDFTSTDDEKENLTLNAHPLNDSVQPVDTITAPLVYVENLEHDDSVEFDKSFNIEDLNSFDDDTVSEMDTMSEYNSPYSKHSRIPRINRSNSCMSFKRRCSLQSLPHNSSRRSSISSRRSSTLSIDERPPWNYGAGGSPYQKLYPFGKRKRLSVDNYYN